MRLAEPAQDTSLQGQRLRLKKGYVNAGFRVPATLRRSFERSRDELFQEGILRGNDLGRFAQRLTELWVVVTFERG